MKYIKILICITILLVCLFTITIKAINYYMPPKELETYEISKRQDDTINVAFIGDSWAFFHHPYDKNLSSKLTKALQHTAKAESYGICGLTSKELYNCFFSNKEMKEFLSKGFDYCIISAGINDTYRKLSKDYYQKSMDHIIKFMLTNNIIPIILEIPNYDINESYRRQTLLRKTIRYISMYLNDTPMDCKQEFREVLNNLISDKYYMDKVYVLRHIEWNSNYQKDLKELYRSDGMHLNQKGYDIIDSCIATYIGLIRQ